MKHVAALSVLFVVLMAPLAISADFGTPAHKHCWHETPESQWVKADAICCHDGRKRSCEGHGPLAPGCSEPKSAPFPPLLKDPEDIRYNYNDEPPRSDYRD